MAPLPTLIMQVSQKVITVFWRLHLPAVADVWPFQVWYDLPPPLLENFFPSHPGSLLSSTHFCTTFPFP